MCDVMKHLIYSIGVYPTVIELEDDEIADLAAFHRHDGLGDAVAPAVFIGGTLVLALTFEIRVAKESASNHESDLEDVKYDRDDPRYYMDALQVRWFVNRRLSQQTYPGPFIRGGYGGYDPVPCCGGQAKPAHVVQPHN
ncbi:hypothetical protein E3N88_18175 [Mikania micrantha]|uniref:Uncharacterized protein n=1 Tax=Mikania micrantha TaxID=192012 RepID=A0A5N6NVB3_9ASTR|nr:hypothetical protein E3N88_18175 [Mikania micrantha]